jgi:hypothetical protein
MSGPFGSSQWMYNTGAGGFYPYEIGQSLRFNDDDSAYLSRTPASAGNRKTWTWSGWLKPGALGTTRRLFMGSQGPTISSTGDTSFLLDANDQFIFQQDNAGTAIFKTNAVFRDPSAWYHFVAVWNSTDATATDRFKVYVNGIRQAGTYTGAFTLNLDGAINSTNFHALGIWQATIQPFDGYMAEVNFIDGSALDPTSFGEFKSGIWVPKAYSGSYGTNGFYLTFEDGAAIGDDLSGNANDWTPSGLASTDVMLDSPTNNYAVLNQLSAGAAAKAVLADGNLFFGITSSSGRGCWATITPPSGKWYWEVTAGSVGGTPALTVGVSLQPTDSKRVRYVSDGTVSQSGLSGTSGTGSFASYTTADVIGVALDVDAKSVAFYKNNVLQTTVAWTDEDDLTPYVSGYNFASTSNFGQSPFAYTPPSGFLPLNTANLTAPAIDPAEDDVPADYFNTVLYTGTGADRAVSGVGFQPDFTWLKIRNTTGNHVLFDGVRGALRELYSNATNAESVETNGLVSWNADGFDLQGVRWNASGDTYVAWNWLAGNGTSSNTDGTITSTVSVNQKAGFSIVGYTKTANDADTYGHGLGAVPAMMIVKSRANVDNWLVYHKNANANPQNGGLALEQTSAFSTNIGYWNNTAPTNAVFTTGSFNIDGAAIAYCFAEVEGFSKFGSYTGNGSTDGPFVYCGFRPAFVMIKRTDSTAGWIVFDSARDSYNLVQRYLVASSSGVEGTGVSTFDFVSNGVKLRSTFGDSNASGGTYIFMAFAEAPFKYSNAR